MTRSPIDPLSLIVIEDSLDDYELIVRRVRAAHPEVFAQRVDSAAALDAALADRTWSAVLSDHRLPGFGSHEALAIVRARTADLPFIIVSGAIGEDAVVEVMRAGADDFVMKDRLNRLDLVLKRALEATAAKRRQRETESAYQESEARLRAVAANLPGMMFRIDIRDGRVTFDYVSDGARRLFGIGADEIAADATTFFGRFATRRCDQPADRAASRGRRRRLPDLDGGHFRARRRRMGAGRGQQPQARSRACGVGRPRHRCDCGQARRARPAPLARGAAAAGAASRRSARGRARRRRARAARRRRQHADRRQVRNRVAQGADARRSRSRRFAEAAR